MENCDAIFEFVCQAPVRPDTETHSDEFLVVSFAPDPGNPDSPDTLLIFTDTNSFRGIDIRKITSAIYYFVCRYGCTDENKINFLLWYTEMLCKKLNEKMSNGLQLEGLNWSLAPADTRFTVGPYRTNFVKLHLFDEGRFTPTEIDVLKEVGTNFNVWVLGDVEPSPEYAGGERELAML